MRVVRTGGRRASGSASVWIVVLVLVGLGAAIGVGLTLSASRTTKSRAPRHTAAPSTTASTLPPPRPYKVTDGVNLRSGPGTSFAKVGTIELGRQVLVV